MKKVGGFTFNISQTLRLIFSVVSLALLLAPTAVAQDKTSGAPSSLDAVASSILKQNLVRVPKEPEDVVVTHEGLFDFTLPRLMKPVGLIPSPDRAAGVIAPDVNRTATGAFRITLEEAQARAVSTQALILAGASVDAAYHHRKAVQSDYFPKVGAYLVNIHYNKFMGDTIQFDATGGVNATGRDAA